MELLVQWGVVIVVKQMAAGRPVGHLESDCLCLVVRRCCSKSYRLVIMKQPDNIGNS